MDGRHLHRLLWGLVVAACGCTPMGVRPNGPGDGEPDAVVHKAPTYVAYADMQAAAGFAKETPPAQQQQSREQARQNYLKALEVDPKHVPAYVGLARLLQACGDYPGATATYGQALEQVPREGSLWFELGICQCRNRSWQEAVDSLHKACELNPGSRQYQLTLGYTLGRAGRLDEALAMLGRAEGEAKAHYDLARLLRHMNQPDLARRQAELAVQKDPRLPEARELLAALVGQPPAPAPAPAGPVRTVSYTAEKPAPVEPAPPGAMPEMVPATPTEAEGQEKEGGETPLPTVITPATYGVKPAQTSQPAGKPIRLPPLPVISTGSK
jgi:tetratricopeptide (TPR) repeat protein